MENMELEKIKKINGESKTKKRGQGNNVNNGENKLVLRTKFRLDTSEDLSARELIIKLIKEANNKDFGREITVQDLVFYALTKIAPKDIEKIKKGSLTEMEKVEKAVANYNLKNQTELTLGEFLVKKLGIC